MKIASVEKILEVYPHPNADSLEFVKVLGYQCIVKKEMFKAGDLVVFIQPDTMLPDHDTQEWAKKYLNGNGRRVKARMFRKEWSFGIVEPISILPPFETYTEGEEIADLIDVTKYEPPAPKDVQAKGNLPFGVGKTDEERYQNLKMEDYFGKEVDITLKIDGQSCSFYYDLETDVFGVMGRSYELKPEIHNNYTAHIERYGLKDKLKQYCVDNGVSLILRGESYGSSIQKFKHNPHAKGEHGWACFSVWVVNTKKYARKGDQHYFRDVCAKIGVPSVPVIESGVILTPELVTKYDTDLKVINGNQFEGVVVQTSEDSFKIINKWYDEKKE